MEVLLILVMALLIAIAIKLLLRANHEQDAVDEEEEPTLNTRSDDP